MTNTPIYDQLAREKQQLVFFIEGSETGYFATDWISIPSEDENELIAEWTCETLRTLSTTASFETRFTHTKRQRRAMLKLMFPGQYRFGSKPLIHNGRKP
ncbi:hypothetical protein ACT3UQ_08840 [Glutamicibacter sp. AOP12-B1-11]|uniref:hypothetical protein n=1 Tax=Glutamicibacter sp. AOP12-B1-11 TaxID=3457725 RepID=UPI0040349C07